jgi:mRNA interferase MazF
MQRGEVRWFRFAGPDKTRPVLVLTRDSALAYLDKVTVAPLTTKVRDIPSEVALDEGDGVPRFCAVNLDGLLTVSRAHLGPLITRLPAARMAEVRSALMFALGLGLGN